MEKSYINQNVIPVLQRIMMISIKIGVLAALLISPISLLAVVNPPAAAGAIQMAPGLYDLLVSVASGSSIFALLVFIIIALYQKLNKSEKKNDELTKKLIDLLENQK